MIGHQYTLFLPEPSPVLITIKVYDEKWEHFIGDYFYYYFIYFCDNHIANNRKTYFGSLTIQHFSVLSCGEEQSARKPLFQAGKRYRQTGPPVHMELLGFDTQKRFTLRTNAKVSPAICR